MAMLCDDSVSHITGCKMAVGRATIVMEVVSLEDWEKKMKK